MKAVSAVQNKVFEASTRKFDELVERLTSDEVCELDHGRLETLVQKEGREVLRLLLQEHLDYRGPGRVDVPVIGADGVVRTEYRPSDRGLTTVVGEVRVDRAGYGKAGHATLFPIDAALNLPQDAYSFGMCRQIAEEVAKNSYAEAVQAIENNTGERVGFRQAEEQVIKASQDVGAFHEAKATATPEEFKATGSISVLTFDQKGIAMLHKDLREETKKRAEEGKHKLDKRLSRGEKKNAKRMAMVAAVYTIQPFVRVPADVLHELRGLQNVQKTARRPKPEKKRVWATLEQDPEEVIEAAFQESFRRDPEMQKQWVALVDGNKMQIDLIQEEAKARGIKVTIILDFIHVIEYVWKAALVFHKEGSKQAEKWVTERMLKILLGKASDVAAGMRRSATLNGIPKQKRKAVDDCARYLTNHAQFLRYHEYLPAGFPIATGVIEGACRHLIKDRMDVTGARWSLRGAEAVLRFRSLRSSDEFEEYWKFHEACELQRNHSSRYESGNAPTAATLNYHGRPALRRIK